MTTPQEMSPEDIARARLAALRRQHRELDEQIAAMAAGAWCAA